MNRYIDNSRSILWIYNQKDEWGEVMDGEMEDGRTYGLKDDGYMHDGLVEDR